MAHSRLAKGQSPLVQPWVMAPRAFLAGEPRAIPGCLHLRHLLLRVHRGLRLLLRHHCRLRPRVCPARRGGGLEDSRTVP